MPSLQEIEKFKTVLNSLGSEPEILAERSEAIEDMLPPQEGLPPDLSDLFAGVEAGAPAGAGPLAEEPLEPAAGKREAAVGAEEEEFDFTSLFGEEAMEGLDTLEGLGLPKEEVSLGVGPVEEPQRPFPTIEEQAREVEGAPAAGPAEGMEAAMRPPGIEAAMRPPGIEAEVPLPEMEEAVAAKALEEFGIPPGLLEPFGEKAEAEAGEEEAFSLPAEGMEAEVQPPGIEAEAPAPAGEEEAPPEGEEILGFTLPEEFGIHEEEVPEAPAAEEQPPVEVEVPAPAGMEAEEEAPIPEEFFAEAPEPGAAPEEAFKLPEEFQLPEEAAGEGAAEAPAAEGMEAAMRPPVIEEEVPAEEAFAEGIEAALRPPETEVELRPPGIEAEMPPVAMAEEALPEAGLAEEAVEEEITLSERRFEALKRSLSYLPRNLKIAIEELIGERGLAGAELRLLTGLLADGAAPAEIAEQVSRITGRRIRLPRGYERLTGVAFEEERRTFAYAFRENILPILRVALLSAAFLSLLAFLGYRYIYRPIYANVIYRQGHAQIAKDRYKLANESFDRANAIIRFKGWYYRYAEAFAGKRQYQLASEKYELLLKHFPLDRKGTLDYADLLTYSMAGYEKSDQILDRYLQEHIRDKDALLARGDNYLEWAAENEKHYEDARFQYASILDYFGERDEVLFRMMRYFMRTGRLIETEGLYGILEKKKTIAVAPLLYASVYTELAGFWFDKEKYGNVRDLLFKALAKRRGWPEAHYELARYYRYLKDFGEEEKALNNSIQLLEGATPLTKQRLLKLIDSYNRLGEVNWRRQEYLDAEQWYAKAIARIESAQKQRIFGRSEQFGLVYKNRGDIYYYISRDLRTALELYRKAEENDYRSPELDYKVGYSQYAAQGYEEALLRFMKVVDAKPTNENALYALANALYYQGYFSAAQGYYLHLLDLLESKKDRIPFLEVKENPEHRALLEYIMKAYNNLGVTYKRLSERSRDPDKEAKALVNLTFSSEFFDVLTRDPETAERGLTKNLAFLNQRGIFYPTRPFELQLYTRIPVDLEAMSF